MNDRWKGVGWNGIRLSAPEAWHPAGIEPSCLMFARDARPVMTVRWASSGRRGWRRVLKRPLNRPAIARMRRSFPGKLRRTLRETAVPEAWRRALAAGFGAADMDAAAAFAWGDAGDGGEGIIIDCRRTSRRFLIHFHRPGAQGEAAVMRRVLASIRSGPENGRILWAVFDIQAEVPEAFRLIGHRFVPGAFELAFRADGRTIRLFRWGPASVLLRNDDLQGFVARRLGISPDTFDAADDALAIEWSGRIAASRGDGPWIMRWKPAAFQRGRAWRMPDRNKILAVQLAGELVSGGDVLENLCASFRVLPAEGSVPGPPV